jgi:gamma-glutamyltranspeptidase
MMRAMTSDAADPAGPVQASLNANDAAIAASAVIRLVAPMMPGLGGDLFAIVLDVPTHIEYGLKASGGSRAGTSIDVLTARGSEGMPQQQLRRLRSAQGWRLDSGSLPLVRPHVD